MQDAGARPACLRSRAAEPRPVAADASQGEPTTVEDGKYPSPNGVLARPGAASFPACVRLSACPLVHEKARGHTVYLQGAGEGLGQLSRRKHMMTQVSRLLIRSLRLPSRQLSVIPVSAIGPSNSALRLTGPQGQLPGRLSGSLGLFQPPVRRCAVLCCAVTSYSTWSSSFNSIRGQLKVATERQLRKTDFGNRIDPFDASWRRSYIIWAVTASQQMARQMVRHGVSVSRIHADDLELPNNGTVILSSCGDLRARSLLVSPSVRPAEIHDHMPAITPPVFVSLNAMRQCNPACQKQ
ncbi:hypothetical protein HDV57DRAFT_96072 [Trichoderma longibrachiatum]